LESENKEIKDLVNDIKQDLQSLPKYNEVYANDFLIDNEKNIVVSIDKKMVERFLVKTKKEKIIFEPKDELIPLSFNIKLKETNNSDMDDI